MEKQAHNGQTHYSSIAAVYQPDQGQLRRTIGLVLLLLIVLLAGFAGRVKAEDRPAGSTILLMAATVTPAPGANCKTEPAPAPASSSQQECTLPAPVLHP